MRVIGALTAVAVLVGVSACGGEETVPERPLTKAERVACEDVQAGLNALASLGLGLLAPVAPAAGEDNDAGLLRTLANLRKQAQTVLAIPDTPLRALEKYVEPAGRLGSGPVNSDDREEMGEAMSEARTTCERIDPKLYSRPAQVDFPKVPCPGGSTTVTVPTGEDPYAFAEDLDFDTDASLDWGDLDGDGTDEVVGSLRCKLYDSDEPAVYSVSVLAVHENTEVYNPKIPGIPWRADIDVTQLGQVLSGRRGAVKDGLLQVAVAGKGKKAKEKLQSYRLVDGRWQRA